MTSGEISNFGTTSGGNVTIKTNGTLALKKGVLWKLLIR